MFPPEKVTSKKCYCNGTPFKDFCGNMYINVTAEEVTDGLVSKWGGDLAQKASCDECADLGITGDIE